jgi:transcriptional regulator with GAF, ATPase, and Fis domain
MGEVPEQELLRRQQRLEARPVVCDRGVTGAPRSQTLDEAMRVHILDALRRTNWVLGGPHGAAARLGVKRTTLAARMEKLGICRPRGTTAPDMHG